MGQNARRGIKGARMTRSSKPQKRVKPGTNDQGKSVRLQMFVDAYIANGSNATQAAISAGYSPKTATQQGSRLLTDEKVRLMLSQRQAVLAQKFELTAENVLRSLSQAIHFDPRKLYRENGSLKDVTELDDDTAAALAGFEVTEEFQGRGEDRESVGFTKKVKWLDKNTAREQAMKHLGLYERDNGQRSPFAGMSRDMLKAVAQRLQGG